MRTDRRIDDVAIAERKAMEALPTGTPEHQAARIQFVGRTVVTCGTQPGGYWTASTDSRGRATAPPRGPPGSLISAMLRCCPMVWPGLPSLVSAPGRTGCGCSTCTAPRGCSAVSGPLSGATRTGCSGRGPSARTTWPSCTSRGSGAARGSGRQDDGWGVRCGIRAHWRLARQQACTRCNRYGLP